MNREILFKGRSYEADEWVEGSFLEEGDSNAYILTSHGTCRVSPDTVCQYTGLKDKNGELIFEGDIVRTKQYGKDSESRQNFRDYDVFQVQYKEASFWIENSTRRFVLTDGIKDIEVIGNIFDNSAMPKDAAQYADQDGLMSAT